MPSFSSKFFSLILLFFVLTVHLNAQNLSSGVVMELKTDDDYQKMNILSLVLVVTNTGTTARNGKLHFISPKGFRNLGSEGLTVTLQPNEKRHIPIKFVIGDEASAGSSLLACQFIDQAGQILAENNITHVIETNSMLTINPIEATIYRSNNSEPISIKVKVNNKGNIKQNITVVCKFPDPTNSNLFIEQTANLGVKKDTTFTFTYQPSASLAKQSNYTVRISGFRNPYKELFGTTTVEVQNIASVQQYQPTEFTNFTQESQSEITSSYRRFDGGVDFYQVRGSGGFNIPSGYLFMRGNIALSENQQIPMVTNTNLTFHQNKNEYSIGNVNKLLEMPMIGRGIEYSHTFEKNQKIELGFIDQNYNLIEKNSWLKYGYGFFAKGIIHSNYTSQNSSAAYMYRYDPYEKAKHNVLGLNVEHNFNKNWQFNAKLNGGLSLYEETDFIKPSFAAESNYIGRIKNWNLNGNYFYSTDYYPGNRRGSTQLQQNISTDFKKNTLHASVLFSNFSPKFYSYTSFQKTTNTRFELGNRFPKWRSFNFNLLYQYQEENSNSYNSIFSSFANHTVQKMNANRMIEQVSWIAKSAAQSAILAIETGAVSYPDQTDIDFQMKLNGTYNYKNFNLNSAYQLGSYYLSEYAFSKVAGTAINYEKLTVSLFYNTNFLQDIININTGVSYIDDVIYGKSPSAFLNAKFTGRKFSTFINSSWYNYSAGAITTNNFTFEIGLTVNLKKTILTPDRKGVIKVLAFYDTNNNYQYDFGEKYAPNYNIIINTIALQTDSNGAASYKKVPYGQYILKQFIQDGWYYDDATFTVNSRTHELLIPLHQSGKLEGKIRFVYNTKTAVDFNHRGSGISLGVWKGNTLVQKIYTDDSGNFTSFLPTGSYTITLDEKSLPSNTYCELKNHEVVLKVGELVSTPDFIIKVKEKKINTKKFSN